MNRRQFLKAAAVSSLFSALRVRDAATTIGEMPYRTLGHTGEKVSIVGVGGFHIGVSEISEEESRRIIRTAIDHGINFMDNSWSYNGGQSEIRMGKALRDGYRQKIFLMTKLDGRNAKTATMQFDGSLKRLQVDHVDLLQFDVVRMDDPEKIFAPGGALEAVVNARRTGRLLHRLHRHKVPKSTYICWISRSRTISSSTPCKCR
jgi:predicted aldo/keto reductase-like oxidoreductase